MLRLPRFDFLTPTTPRDAAVLLRDAGTAMLVAGGTDSVSQDETASAAAGHPDLARSHDRPAWRLVRWLGRAHRCDDHAHRSCGTSGASHASSACCAKPPASVSTPQLRNAGTLGGNLCLDTRCNWYDQSLFWRQAAGYCMKTHSNVVCRVATSSSRCLATASADTVPALLALDARVTVTGPDGERESRP
jgi:4-hydroxybenzoyl-CoA reductase subunit beta